MFSFSLSVRWARRQPSVTAMALPRISMSGSSSDRVIRMHPGAFCPYIMKLSGGIFGLCPLRFQIMNRFSYTYAIGTGVWQDFKLFNPLLDIMEPLLLFSLQACKWPNRVEHRSCDLTQVRYLSSFPSAEIRFTDTFIFPSSGMEPILTLDLVWFGPMLLTSHPTASAKHKVWSVSTMLAPLGQL